MSSIFSSVFVVLLKVTCESFQLELGESGGQSLIVEEGSSVKVRVSYSVPESHKFDPVSVEFGFAYMNLGNDDQNFLLQGFDHLALTFVYKGYIWRILD